MQQIANLYITLSDDRVRLPSPPPILIQLQPMKNKNEIGNQLC